MITPGSKIVLYIRPWCGNVMRVKQWLDQHGIPYSEIDISRDAAAARHCAELNGGYQSTPTILVDGIHVCTEPTTAELERLFG